MTDQNGMLLSVGDIVQIAPEHDDIFGGCFMVIDEVKNWGAQGYVPAIATEGAVAWYRCPTEAMVFVGRAAWTIAAEWTIAEETEEGENDTVSTGGSGQG